MPAIRRFIVIQERIHSHPVWNALIFSWMRGVCTSAHYGSPIEYTTVPLLPSRSRPAPTSTARVVRAGRARDKKVHRDAGADSFPPWLNALIFPGCVGCASLRIIAPPLSTFPQSLSKIP